MDRSDAERLDREDPLHRLGDLFGGKTRGIYLDGNSLGRPPAAVRAAVADATAEWERILVDGWEEWFDLPVEVGDRLGRLVGAGPGQIAVCDSTTVNLYKVVSAALAARPGRARIVGLAGDFPTDRYVLQGLAAGHGRELHLVAEADLEAAVDASTAVVCVSHVHFVTGRRIDAVRLIDVAHRHGALVVLDLAHSAGAVEVDLDAWDADLAVGCSYKYLNAGPGSPGWLYVNRRLHESLRQPIWGWFGQADQFAMAERYDPAAGIRSWLTGSPPILALRAVDAAVGVIEAAGAARLWARSAGLTGLLIDRARQRLEPLGVRVVTPADPARRGGHVALSHPEAWKWCRALVEQGRVIGDFRPPDVLRVAPVALYTSYVDCFDAVEAMADVLAGGFDGYEPRSRRVT